MRGTTFKPVKSTFGGFLDRNVELVTRNRPANVTPNGRADHRTVEKLVHDRLDVRQEWEI